MKNLVEFHPMHGRRGEITSLAGTMEKGLLRVGVRVVEQALQPRSLEAAVVVRALKRGLQEVLLAQMLIQLDLGLGNKVTQGASAWFLCFVAFAVLWSLWPVLTGLSEISFDLEVQVVSTVVVTDTVVSVLLTRLPHGSSLLPTSFLSGLGAWSTFSLGVFIASWL